MEEWVKIHPFPPSSSEAASAIWCCWRSRVPAASEKDHDRRQCRHMMRRRLLKGGLVGSMWAGRWHDVAINCSVGRKGAVA